NIDMDQPQRCAQVASSSTAMELDSMRLRKLSVEEKQRRREQGFCLYCGLANRYTSACPSKKPLALDAVATDSGNESA
ncbi:hypothetical protein BGZ58_005041, partial [Dissophora ornata]